MMLGIIRVVKNNFITKCTSEVIVTLAEGGDSLTTDGEHMLLRQRGLVWEGLRHNAESELPDI